MISTTPSAKTWPLCAALALCAGCGSNTTDLIDGEPDDNTLPGLESITLTPEISEITIDDLTVQHTVEFAATGHFSGGDSRDITALIDWGVDNSYPGSFLSPGAWRSSNQAGGEVVVEARSGRVAATAAITVLFSPVIHDPAFPPPQDVDDLFDPGADVVVGVPDESPVIVYPANRVKFPINVYRILFQYELGASSDVYRVRFQSPHLDLQVFTTGDRWQADETTWSYLALTNAGGQVVMTVAGVSSADPGTIYQSEPVEVLFSRSAVEGAIYYWSTSSEGVMKGVLSEPAPTKFYTQPPDDECVACHTVSRDGTLLAVGYGGETLREVTIPDREVLISDDRGHGMGWSTFSPDSSLLLIADKGDLRLLDAATGDPVGPGDGLLDLGGTKVSHPDWSPLGDFVAVSVCDRVDNKEVEKCGVARIPYNGSEFGPLETLVPAAGGDDNNFFPKYSPDGQWIAYVNAAGKSKDQDLSELRLVAASGGEPILLTRATRRVGPADGVADTGSTMPTWAPSTHPGTQWLGFSSVRDYGKVLTGDKADQLWVVALDLDLAAQGQDPSYAAFWLPLQDSGERNHRAFWAHDVEQPCTGDVEVCDGFDNDCDGQVDEDCVACEDHETCDDGVDNDCDGEIDEGCIIVE